MPAVREGRRNLALLPAAKAQASSVLSGGAMAIHQTAHLNDGWYGNGASWIADQMPAWAEVDLGSVCKISRVILGNDQRVTTPIERRLRCAILAATNYAADSSAASWRAVAAYDGEGILQEKSFTFEPVSARWVRVELRKSLSGMARLDEIEIYEAESGLRKSRPGAFAMQANAVPEPPRTEKPGPLLCLGSKQYLDEAAKRLLANCADGAVFLMFDGDWWNGGCTDPGARSSHPVPHRRPYPRQPGFSPACPCQISKSSDRITRSGGGGTGPHHAGLLQVRPASELRRELGLRADVGPDG